MVQQAVVSQEVMQEMLRVAQERIGQLEMQVQQGRRGSDADTARTLDAASFSHLSDADTQLMHEVISRMHDASRQAMSADAHAERQAREWEASLREMSHVSETEQENVELQATVLRLEKRVRAQAEAAYAAKPIITSDQLATLTSELASLQHLFTQQQQDKTRLAHELDDMRVLYEEKQQQATMMEALVEEMTATLNAVTSGEGESMRQLWLPHAHDS